MEGGCVPLVVASPRSQLNLIRVFCVGCGFASYDCVWLRHAPYARRSDGDFSDILLRGGEQEIDRPTRDGISRALSNKIARIDRILHGFQEATNCCISTMMRR